MTPLRGKTLIFNAGKESAERYHNRQDTVHPDVSVVFNPFQPPMTPLELTGETMDKLLVSLSCMKSRSQPGGFFTFTIIDEPGAIKTFNVLPWKRKLNSLLEMFHPMTQIQLWIDGLHVMTGYVVKAERTAAVKSPPLLTVEVSELGNLYAESIFSKQLQLYGLDTNVLGDVQGQMEATLAGMSGLPLPRAVNALCTQFWNSTLLYKRGNPFPFFRFSDGMPAAARMIAQPPPLGAVSTASILQTFICDTTMFERAGGSCFWDFLKYMVPDPFCEMWTESGGRTICTGRLGQGTPTLTDLPGAGLVNVPGGSLNISTMIPGFNYLVLRSTPYDNPYLGWTAFKQTYPFTLGVFDLMLAGDFVIVDDRDITSKNLGRSMLKQYNSFYTRLTAGSGTESFLAARPSIASGPKNPLGHGGVRSFPIRTLDVTVDATSTAYLGYAAQSLQQSDRLQQELVLNNLLNVHYRNEHRFRYGSITTGRFLPHARPGMLMLYLPPYGMPPENPDDLGVYYIDNVSHDFQAGSATSTTLTVIRGTPIPMTAGELARVLTEWEVHPIIPETYDYPSDGVGAGVTGNEPGIGGGAG